MHGESWGRAVIILGHHYQRDDVIKHADLTGDSYQLSVMASQTDAEFIVFCGVHFMAESADILGKPHSGNTSRLGCRMLDGRHGDYRSGRGRVGSSLARSAFSISV
jgi:quinolinate synthase